MKNIFTFILALITFVPVMAKGEVNLDSIPEKNLLVYAYRFKHGINTDVNLRAAAKIYMHLARKGQVDGMRELGRMYLYGQGVKRNYKYAYRLLRRASQCEDAKSMCLLAKMYQQALGVKQNYQKAFDLYRAAAFRGNARAYYGAGYLLYKGLGISQDYVKAVRYFEKGSKLHNSACDYMLGCYYMSGYGEASDYDKATEYFDRAMKGGFGWTVDIAKYGIIDSLKKVRAQRAAMPMLMDEGTPRTCAEVDSMLSKLPADTLGGGWSGTVYTCDWSGNKILKEERLAMNITPQDTLINVAWTWGDNDSGEFAAMSRRGKSWRITRLGDNERGRKWVITSMAFGLLDSNTLCARLRCMNVKHYERRKPVFAVLHRDEPLTPGVCSPFRILQVSPMPVTNGAFTVTLQSDAECKVNVSIYAVNGMKAADCCSMYISKGENDIQLNALLAPGQYILRITGERGNASSTIICK